HSPSLHLPAPDRLRPQAATASLAFLPPVTRHDPSFFPPVQPQVTLYPSKMAPPGHHNLLFCSISGFYPGDIEVWWFLNGREETAGVQTLVMLEMTPQHGDVYTCHVKHSSLQRPIILDWSPLLLHPCLP
uniref:Ig-like domain-containing protein n=1 Tax=Sarcophilus harrisii TaxID=9305 RepID=A0A7N4P4X5_SARHA